MENNKQPLTISQSLGILSIIVIPLIAWGISVETRLAQFELRIKSNEEKNSIIYSKLDAQTEKLNAILILLERKEDKQ